MHVRPRASGVSPTQATADKPVLYRTSREAEVDAAEGQENAANQLPVAILGKRSAPGSVRSSIGLRKAMRPARKAQGADSVLSEAADRALYI